MKNSAIKKIKHISGVILFSIFNRIECRYLLPISFLVSFIEKTRVISLQLMGAEIGEDSFVRSNLYITTPRRLTIGKGSKIGPNSELWSYGGIHIGDNVEIGSRLVIHTEDHLTSDSNKPLAKQGGVWEEVSINSDVYIGSGVTILSGVTIESRLVIGTGSVVTNNLKSGYIYAGVPAKVIKKLK